MQFVWQPLVFVEYSITSVNAYAPETQLRYLNRGIWMCEVYDFSWKTLVVFGPDKEIILSEGRLICIRISLLCMDIPILGLHKVGLHCTLIDRKSRTGRQDGRQHVCRFHFQFQVNFMRVTNGKILAFVRDHIS